MWDYITTGVVTQVNAFSDLFAALIVMAAPKIAVVALFAIKIHLMYISYMR